MDFLEKFYINMTILTCLNKRSELSVTVVLAKNILLDILNCKI